MQQSGNSQKRHSLDRQLKDINTMQLGDIVKITDAKKGICDIQLSTKRNLGGSVVEQAPLIDVPYYFLETPDFAITLPLRDDNLPIPCMVFFAQRSIARRMKKGGTHHPKDVRSHDLSDAIAFVGMPSVKNRDYEINSENLQIRACNSDAKIEMSRDGKFKITNGDTDLLSILHDCLDALSSTKAVVSGGSSSGNWIINTASTFSSLKNKLKDIML